MASRTNGQASGKPVVAFAPPAYRGPSKPEQACLNAGRRAGKLGSLRGSQSPTVRRDNPDVSVLRLIFDRPGWRIEQLRDVLNGGI